MDKWPEMFDLLQSLIHQKWERECNSFSHKMNKHLNEHLNELCEPKFCHRTGLLS